MITKIKIPVDISRLPASVPYFKKLTSIEIDEADLYKLGIFKHEVPPTHVCESDYLYLMSKVSAYVQLYRDFILIKGNIILNTSTDDRNMKDVSEIVGIALGIKLTIDQFNVRQEQITKIPPPSKKQKYLDYQFVYQGQAMELETKGTTTASIGAFVRDILDKKAASESTRFRFGTVAVLSKPGEPHKTVLHVCDDPPEDLMHNAPFDSTPMHYISALGFLLDNKYYNEVIKTILHGKKPTKRIGNARQKFFGKYIFNGEHYFGEYFDYRLNIKNVAAAMTGNENTVDEVFTKVTKAQGKTKIFIGIHTSIVDLVLQGKGLDEIFKLHFEKIWQRSSGSSEILRDTDGIIVVVAPDRLDPQFEAQFTELEVKRRLACMINLERNQSSNCGAPCRSREKSGKSCAIKTVRGHCHFHR